MPSDKIQLFTIAAGLSVLLHLLVLFSLGRFGSCNFSGAAMPLPAVMIDLAKQGEVTTPIADAVEKDAGPGNGGEDVADNGNLVSLPGSETRSAEKAPEESPDEPEAVEQVPAGSAMIDTVMQSGDPATKTRPSVPSHTLYPIPPRIRTTGEFLASANEKLSYLVSMKGLPVGSMELEAASKNGEVRITLRTRSNSAMSTIYSVDDIMETRHIAGNFIISNVRKQEGSFKSDTGFTIFLRDKRVFWFDRIRKRYTNETVPTSEVLDTLSSFYYIRNRPLQTGKTEMLHIYDGDIYAAVPIEVVRKEKVLLRSLKKVDTLLLRHIKQKEGIFKRTGDMMIWLTDDAGKVPVRLETSTPLGDIVVELVSAESKPYQNPVP